MLLHIAMPLNLYIPDSVETNVALADAHNRSEKVPGECVIIDDSFSSSPEKMFNAGRHS